MIAINPTHRLRTVLVTVGLIASGVTAASCSSNTAAKPVVPSAPVASNTQSATQNTVATGATTPTAATTPSAPPSPVDSVPLTSPTADPSVVLPVADNPIKNDSTVQALVIDSVLVENNVGTNGAVASDHLEIALSNSSTADLAGVEVFYTYSDPSTGVTESYYTKLPDSFTIAAGAKRVIHFDDTGAPDHFPVNKFSLYYTDTNAMDVTVEVSAKGAAAQTATIQKDPGGTEAAD